MRRCPKGLVRLPKVGLMQFQINLISGLMQKLARFFIISTIIALFSAQAIAAEDLAIAKLFAERGVAGTMVISSLHTGHTLIHNNLRAMKRFSPASTFKIPNTLIALEAKAITGKDDVLKWDGYQYDFPDWNRDQTLESAFKVSCVWCYQELAKRVGVKQYQHDLHKIDYGQLHMPFEVTTFWLDGSLKISAIEQVKFLKKVYLQSLPFSPSSYDILRQIMLVEQSSILSIRAKTGWATRVKPQVGWYVGYVETSKDVFFFAMNMVINDKKELPLRQQLTHEALRIKGFIE